MSAPKISVIIPTWNGADVLADALRCVQDQTVQELEIIVAVDRSDDATAAIAAAAASRDGRIRPLVHRDRIGWVRNVNAALDQVRGKYFCLYFHDDLIEPTYLAVLSDPLDADPSCVAAYCAVIQDSGASQFLDQGRAYRGATGERLLQRLLLLPRGAPFRALTRTSLLGQGLRLPEGSFSGFQGQLAYLVRLVAAGEVHYDPAALYRRRTWRQGALTRGWKSLPTADCIADLRVVEADIADVIDEAVPDPAERRAVLAAVRLTLAETLRFWERDVQATELAALEEVFPGLDDLDVVPPRFRDGATRIRDNIAGVEQRWRAKAQTQ